MLWSGLPGHLGGEKCLGGWSFLYNTCVVASADSAHSIRIPGSRLPRLGAGEPRGGGGQAGGPSGCHGEVGRAGAECQAQSCRAQVLTTEGVLFQQARVSVSTEAGVCTHLTWCQGAECGPDPCSCTAAPATTGRERVLLRPASPGSQAWCNHSLPKGMPPPHSRIHHQWVGCQFVNWLFARVAQTEKGRRPPDHLGQLTVRAKPEKAWGPHWPWWEFLGKWSQAVRGPPQPQPQEAQLSIRGQREGNGEVQGSSWVTSN